MTAPNQKMMADAAALIALGRTVLEVAQVLAEGKEPTAEQWAKLANEFELNDALMMRAEQIRASRG